MSEKSTNKSLYEDCRAHEVFWTTKGEILHSMKELIDSLEGMDDWTFKYHVNDNNNKNDFADWIRDVWNDDSLCMKLEGVTEKRKFLDILKDHIK